MLTQSLPPREMHARPNCAPAYYQGRPATLWIAVMGPRKSGTADGHVQTARHPVAIPRPRQPQTGVTIPPTPRLSAVHWAMGRRARRPVPSRDSMGL